MNFYYSSKRKSRFAKVTRPSVFDSKKEQGIQKYQYANPVPIAVLPFSALAFLDGLLLLDVLNSLSITFVALFFFASPSIFFAAIFEFIRGETFGLFFFGSFIAITTSLNASNLILDEDASPASLAALSFLIVIFFVGTFFQLSATDYKSVILISLFSFSIVFFLLNGIRLSLEQNNIYLTSYLYILGTILLILSIHAFSLGFIELNNW